MLGAPSHGGLPALMDASASRELWRHAHSHILVINPVAAALTSPASRPGEPAAAAPAGPARNGSGAS